MNEIDFDLDDVNPIKIIDDGCGEIHNIYKVDDIFILNIAGEYRKNIIEEKNIEDVQADAVLHQIEKGIYYDAYDKYIVRYDGSATTYTVNTDHRWFNDHDETYIIFTDDAGNETIVAEV